MNVEDVSGGGEEGIWLGGVLEFLLLASFPLVRNPWKEARRMESEGRYLGVSPMWGFGKPLTLR